MQHYIYSMLDTGVDIDFTQSSYTFNEYDRIVDVCATTSNQTTYDVNFVFSVETQESQSHSATGNSITDPVYDRLYT